MKRLNVSLASSLLVVGVLTSCGNPQNGDNFLDSNERTIDTDDATLLGWQDRFTGSQVNELYSNQTAPREGSVWPVSRAPIVQAFRYEQAPSSFKREFGQFTWGAEARAYINVATEPGSTEQARLVSTYERVTGWKNLRDETGKALMRDSFTTNSRFARIADTVDGRISSGETRYAKVKIKASVFSVPIQFKVEMRQLSDRIQIRLKNLEEVSAPVVGRVIEAGDLKLAMEYFPHRNGWLAWYGISAELLKLEEDINGAKVSSIITSFSNWIVDEVTLPVNF